MAKYTFKQFQAEYPDDAACLAKLMEINYGGDRNRLSRLQAAGRVPPHDQAPRLCLPRVRPPHLPGCRDHLPQVAHAT